MTTLGIRTIQGPNVFHSLPVLVLKLDLQQWVEVSSADPPHFIRKLLKALPGLNLHTCSPGYVGGFVERLRHGTYPAHIIEHVAIELANLAGMNVKFGKTNYAGAPGIYDVVVRFVNEEAMKLCLITAVDIVENILENRSVFFESKIEIIRQVYLDTKLGPSGQCLVDAAEKRGIPCRPLGFGSLLEMGQGKYRRRVQAAVTDQTGLISKELVEDKFFTKMLLNNAGVPVPVGEVIHQEEELLKVMKKFAGPYAIKPLCGHHGDGIMLNLKSREDLFKGYYEAKKYSNDVLIEEMCSGRDYRILVVGGKFSAAAERFPPRVLGDGECRIQDLINKLNRDPKRGDGHESYLTRVTVDESVIETLKKQKLDLQSVPLPGLWVTLRENANLSSGGTSKDVTDEVHSEIRAVCERVSRIVDLDVCGIDIIAQDLSTPLNSSFKVIEVNAGPGLRMHLSPAEGQARRVGEDIINMLYPPEALFRIPLVAVTGTNGKTTTVRLIHKILSSDAVVGLTTTDGVFIGSNKVASGDTTGPISAQIILSDTSVDKAVLEVARGGILRRGLAYDWSDVGVVTNIRPDHIGQDGIESLEDLVWIKSLIAERVRKGGTIVLNADDEESFKLKSNPKILRIERNFFIYSINSQNRNLRQHINAGGDAAWHEDGWIYFIREGKKEKLIATSDLAFAFSGKAKFQISNTLAAVAASLVMGAQPQQITNGLKSFQSTTENQGRLNLYKVGEGYVILDYGHNPDAIGALGELLSLYENYTRTAVIGLPGDRADNILLMSAEAIGKYCNKIVLRDDGDLRGREPGEVPNLIERFITKKYPDVQCIKILNEKKAVEKTLSQIKRNEIILILFDTIQEVLPVIRQFDPVAVSELPELKSLAIAKGSKDFLINLTNL